MADSNSYQQLHDLMLKRSRDLRTDSTFPERLLWSILRNRGLIGLKFRRQHIIGQYAVDFFCEPIRLVIELDGESHDQTYDQDRRREKALRDQGLTILRFTNDEVLDDLDAVCLAIQLEAEKLAALQPSPRGEGGERSEPGEGTMDNAEGPSNDNAMDEKTE